MKFKVGDVVRPIAWLTENTWTIVSREDHQLFSVNAAYYLIRNDGVHQITQGNMYNWELIEPEFMPYDPSQQEDLDSDI